MVLRRESQVCVNYCVSSSNSKKHDACAQAELSKVRLLYGRSDLPQRRALPYLWGACLRVLNPFARDVHFDACNLFDRLFSGHRDL